MLYRVHKKLGGSKDRTASPGWPEGISYHMSLCSVHKLKFISYCCSGMDGLLVFWLVSNYIVHHLFLVLYIILFYYFYYYYYYFIFLYCPLKMFFLN